MALNETEPMLSRAPQQGKRLELRDLERAIAKLPEEQRSVILLVGLEGMRYEEVAAVLGVPVGTIRSRLSRGREALRRLTGAVPERGMADVAVAKNGPPTAPGHGILIGRTRSCKVTAGDCARRLATKAAQSCKARASRIPRESANELSRPGFI